MFFFDSYALIEIIKGNKSYKKYLKERVILTKLNLMEIYYSILKDYSEEKADHYYSFYLPACIPVPDNIVKKAMKFKLKMRLQNKRLSYQDCIGYLLALENNLKFLTGDEEFRSMENVEFVK